MHATVFAVSRLYAIVNEAVLCCGISTAIGSVGGRASKLDYYVTKLASTAVAAVCGKDVAREWKRSAVAILAMEAPASWAAVAAHRAMVESIPPMSSSSSPPVTMSLFCFFHEVDNCLSCPRPVGPKSSSCILDRCLAIVQEWVDEDAAATAAAAAAFATMCAVLRRVVAMPGKQPYPVWALYQEAFEAFCQTLPPAASP